MERFNSTLPDARDWMPKCRELSGVRGAALFSPGGRT